MHVCNEMVSDQILQSLSFYPPYLERAPKLQPKKIKSEVKSSQPAGISSQGSWHGQAVPNDGFVKVVLPEKSR